MSTASAMDVSASNLREVLGAIGRGEGAARRSWFTRLVTAYLRYRDHKTAPARPADGLRPEVERAQAVIRAACIKSALGGVASGMVLTGATIVTAEAPAGAFIAVPVAALGVGAEMIVRALIHLDMTCDLAAIFGLRFDPDDPVDFWQLYGLAFKAEAHEDADDPGRALVHRLGEVEAHELGGRIGDTLLGESVLKNVVPFLGIATASVTNWRRTRHLGDTARRYLRYRRALGDALAVAEDMCRAHLDLLIEGLWFIFIADGQLAAEEATVLAGLLRKLDPAARAAVEGRFVDDETDWLARLAGLPEPVRASLLYALEVGAAVDKKVALPEQRILARAARALGRELDMDQVNQMMQAFEEVGVLRDHAPRGAPASAGGDRDE